MLTLAEKIERNKHFLARTDLTPTEFPRFKALWSGDDGELRVGHSGDISTMLDDMNVRSR